MHIFLIIKCGSQDSYHFISQITQLNNVSKVTVFRDAATNEDPKVDYILPYFKMNPLFKQIGRYFQILKRKKLKPNLIIGIYEIPHGLLAVLAGKIMKIPSVVSVIGNPAYTKLRRGLRMIITKWILRSAHAITVTGMNSKQFLISLGISPEKIFILPNSFDLNQLSKDEGAQKEYDLVNFGRISKEKHVEIIISIVSHLKLIRPDIKAGIAGNGPELENIKELVHKMKLGENINLLGFIPDEDIEGFLNSGRVFVLTSETEGLPRTILQAAACGIPVVASDVGDVSDVIKDSINGFLIKDYKNIDEYSNKILMLLNNNNLRESFSENILRKVHKSFSHQEAQNVWDCVLKEVLK